MAADYFDDDIRSNYERMQAGEPYIADDPQMHEDHQRAVTLAKKFDEEYHRDLDRAQEVVRELLGSLGRDSLVRAPLWVDYGHNIHIGDETFINFNLTALDVAPIYIGNHCQIGPNVQLLTPTHPTDPQVRRDKLESAAAIKLGDNVWLGGGVIVLAGVSIGENTVVGAGSVVTKSLPANVVAVGNPARVIRKIQGGTDARHPDGAQSHSEE